MAPLATLPVEDPVPEAASASPVDDAEFAALIDRLGPFEAAPHLAVGVSGGPDSMALALLAARWVRARGGKITALIVDHGLRAESAREAATVARWLGTHGIAHATLRWEGPKPASAIQAAARAARHAALAEWCRTAGVLHLLLAHHRDDQIETMLLRREGRSGPDGLAAMAAVVERDSVRILRPLLPVPSARLRATLQAAGQGWVDDPSNRNPAFTRVRIRADLAGRSAAEIAGFAATRDQLAEARIRSEHAVADLLAASVAVQPEGWTRLDPRSWQAAAPDVVRRALTRLVLTIGGGAYAPRGERLDRLLQAVLDGGLAGGRTLGGCRFVPRGPEILVVREPAAAAERLAVDGPGTYLWDGRFAVTVAGQGPWPRGRFVLARLGAEGWREIAADLPENPARTLPAAVRPSLPSLLDLEGVRAVPHLMYGRRGADPDSVAIVSAMFRPRHALAGPGFATI
jgi:tRNA(Ile)-lysidine synthase